MSPRSPRVAARMAGTRQRILAAARTVVAEHGFAAAQVAVVASVADVATGSVYRHFPSKAALFAEMLRTICDRELEVVRTIAEEDGRPAVDRIGDAVAVFVERALRGEDLAYAVIVEPMDREIDQVRLRARAALGEVFAGLIETAVRSGEVGAQDARARGAAIVGAMLEALVAPLADRSELADDLAGLPGELARFCQAAVVGGRGATATPAIPPSGRTVPAAPRSRAETA